MGTFQIIIHALAFLCWGGVAYLYGYKNVEIPKFMRYAMPLLLSLKHLKDLLV